jgi:hypothetical protein
MRNWQVSTETQKQQETTKRRKGQEMKEGNQKRRNITINDRHYEKAKQISKQNGNESPSYSEGIRIAVEAYEVKR